MKSSSPLRQAHKHLQSIIAKSTLTPSPLHGSKLTQLSFQARLAASPRWKKLLPSSTCSSSLNSTPAKDKHPSRTRIQSDSTTRALPRKTRKEESPYLNPSSPRFSLGCFVSTDLNPFGTPASALKHQHDMTGISNTAQQHDTTQHQSSIDIKDRATLNMYHKYENDTHILKMEINLQIRTSAYHSP